VVAEVAEHSPQVHIITVLDPVTTEAMLASLRVGAVGAIGLYESPDDVMLAIEAAERGRVILPSCVARPLIEKLSCELEIDRLDESDVSCLRALADGKKVAQVARGLGYSEREMYRRLRRLYSTMGVRGRTEALMVAVRSGLID
jgi:DNA-binding NarL/FixJ family response regulator